MNAEIDASIRLSGYSPRYQAIDDVERFYHGTQYEVGQYKREHDWEDERDQYGGYIPLKKRRPYDFGIAKALVDKPTAFLFDEGRFPKFIVEGDEGASALLDAVVEEAALRLRFLEAARLGGRARSVFIYFKLIDGKPVIETHNGKECQPVFERDGKTVKTLRKVYKVAGTDLIADGYSDIDPDAEYWFRHDFTETAEVKYFPVKVVAGAWAPTFQKDAARSFIHNLGFVPGVWIANLERSNGYDGIATYERAIPIIHLCNVLLSQSHRAIGQACDPQAVLEYDPDKDPDVSALKNQTKGGVWLMPGSMKLLEMTGKGQEIALTQFSRYAALIADMTSVPEVDTEKLSGAAQSAEALRVLYQALIAFAGILRVNYGDQGLAPFAKLILRVLKATPGSLAFEAKDADGNVYSPKSIKDDPKVKLEWGAWFEPTVNDQQATINALAAAVSSGLLSQETAVAHVARLFDRDAEEELKRITDEKQVRMDEAMRQMEAQEGALEAVGKEASSDPFKE